MKVPVDERSRAWLITAMQANPGKIVRVTSQGYGCGGLELGVSLDERTARDEIFEDGELVIAVKKHVLAQIGDFLIEWFGAPDTGWVSARPISVFSPFPEFKE